MAFYEVTVLASVQMLVEAENGDEAAQVAFDKVDFSRAGHKETHPARLVKTGEEVDRLRRLGDQVVEA